jgi:hypothetical protein
MSFQRGVVATLLVLIFAQCACAAEAEAPQKEKVVRKKGVRLYLKASRIEMDGKFCLAKGPVELLACAKGGKEYESVIALDADLEVLHFCLLLAKQKPGAKGSQLVLKVRWSQDGKVRTVRAERLCRDAKGQPLPPSTWTFAGLPRPPRAALRMGKRGDDRNIAAVWGGQLSSVIKLVAPNADPPAELSVNSKLVPKPGTPCTLIVEPAPSAKPRKHDKFDSRPAQK